MRGLPFSRGDQERLDRDEKRQTPRKSPCSGLVISGDSIAGQQAENLGDHDSAIMDTGHTDQKPRYDSPLSPWSCPSGVMREVRA
jgi:hypothetical protein